MNPPPPSRRIALPVTRPRLVWALLGINILVFIVETILGGSENQRTLVTLGAKVNALIVMGQYWRLITPMFLHIGLMHVLFNSYAIYAIGPEVEALYGRSRFLTLYLLSGVAGNLMSFAFTPALSAGASTAIFGLIGALLMFYYRQRQNLGAFGQQRLINIVGIIIINLLFGMTVSGIDNFGHLGGFIGGVVLGWLLCPVYEVDYGLDGPAQVQDRNSLLRELPGVGLFVVLLVVATGAVTLQKANRPEVKLQQGLEAFNSGDYTTALPLLEKAAYELPNDAQAQYLLAADYFNLSRYAEAVPAFEQALQLVPDLADAHFYLAKSYLHLDRRSDAGLHLRRYLVLAPTGDKADQAQQLLTQLGE
jgi:rhomboid protease GluP